MEKVLPYKRPLVVQETGWWCGPASVQTVLQSKGIEIPESQIAAAIEEIENPGRGDDRDGTDHIGLIETYLDRRVPEANYTSVQMPNDPPTKTQVDRLFAHVKRSVDAGWGVVANIVSPPGNKPSATKGSVPPPYPRGIWTWHYVAIMGYDDDPSNRAVWIADSAAFGGVTGWWCPLEGRGSISSLIPRKGYCYADVSAPTTTPTTPTQPPQGINPVEWDIVLQAVIGVLLKEARTGDVRATRALATLEQINRAALEKFIKEGSAA